MDKYIGKRLDGRYEIHELIGVGGMANVYRCNDTLDDREVAIKILKDEYLNNEEFIRRFKNESKAIATLSHPNIVKVYDVSFGDMIQYIVMEYIDGITLKEYFDQQGIIEWKEALYLTSQVLKALQHAHEHGIVHRDIKPQNIMLLQDGTIKVTDFGIARFSDKATRTMTEHAIGSVHYISPEQARGEATDGKSDIYSVGVMLYEMLTGKLPFDADSAVSVALMQLQSTPKRPRELNPTIPIGLEQITMKAMEKNPADRYNSAAEMLNDMERFRLNPSIVFDYSKFVDNQPTKFVTSLKDTKTNSTKFDKAVAKPEETPEPEIETAEEEKKVEHKPSYYAIKGIVISAVVVVAVFVGLAIFRGCSTSQAKDVEIPNFVGKTLAEANADNKDNFNFVVESKYDASKELGVILEQEPAADSKLVKSGSQITLKVNGTDTNASVPYVLNYSEKDASAIIEEKSLVPKIIYVENTKTPKGYVAEVFPKAGVHTNIGSTVYIYIANGERDEKVTIPSVSGLLLSEAKTKLVDAGLTVETVYDDESKEAKDTVLSQSPLQYGKVDKGTVVTLTVSSGKGDVATVNVYVDLPTNATESVEMTVIVDGVVDTKYSKTLVPQYNKTCTLEFTGSGTSNIVVQLDGQVYREYSIDYSTLVVTQTATHEYAVPTTAPVVTEPAYTEPPVTEPPYTPVQPTDATEPSEALH
ncbi:Stk1 family PASTA domain-containing Ser/Thr kinase [Ruminococcus sp. FMB-CY1]|uniref:Stk1 family PASTA domain-containing Ser/Thr kinase n=1 Tax=unclassified Ruminococcus TaxID=2608920 RepID=UPI00208F0895|nr:MULTISPECIES: Stk1 family PASTA domain-containing Ser/Thr kinase [unclassified Ruminococcus]USP70505.1 Stk1 family PASTA domain-containing Ser/Thr kinase [Ruminococcus sp. FMBCY1]WBX58325.1 Stk1 family PASTA domain-containing Ser/Thr kinase [Ruminococcus sp. FMB-CY1]